MNILIAVIILAIGIAAGALIGDLPYVTFKREVDLAACIAVLGLLGTFFYIPYVVERKFAKIDNINGVIREDLQSLYKDVKRLEELYMSIKPNTLIKEAMYIEVLELFKAISSGILALNKELEERKRLKDFKKDTYDERFTPAKDACTDTLIVGRRMDTKTTLDAMAELHKLCAVLQRYRYKTYSDN